jgi:hypothetical protein
MPAQRRAGQQAESKQAAARVQCCLAGQPPYKSSRRCSHPGHARVTPDHSLAEFLHEVEYHPRLSVRLSERFAKAFRKAVRAAQARAAEPPELWPKPRHKTRLVADRTFKFSLVYLCGGSEFAVVALAPFRRRPGSGRRGSVTPSPQPDTPRHRTLAARRVFTSPASRPGCHAASRRPAQR